METTSSTSSTSSTTSKDEKEQTKEEQTVENLGNSIYLIQLGDANYEESLKLAEQYKQEGNKLLQENSFYASIEKYTQAINLRIETKNNAVKTDIKITIAALKIL